MNETFHHGRGEDASQLTKKATAIRIIYLQSKKTMKHFNKQSFKIQVMPLTNLK